MGFKFLSFGLVGLLLGKKKRKMERVTTAPTPTVK